MIEPYQKTMVQLKSTHPDRLQKRLAELLADAPVPRSVNGTEAQCLGTNTGTVRTQNEDRALIVTASYSDVPERNFVLGVVSDGIGGLPRGDEASTLAVSEFCSWVVRHSKLAPEARLRFAAEMANDAVFSLLKGRGGATLSAAMIVKGKIVGVNVGDSRIYSISSDKRNAQMTRDDNLASYIGRRDGKAANLGEKGLVQFVGMGDGIEPHIVTPHEKDTASILITSDGVHDAPPEAIAQIVQISRSSLDMVQRLLSLSSILGGRDNATALVVPANLNSGKISERGITIACASPFDDLEIWIPVTENVLVEGNDAEQKLQAQEVEVEQSNFKERKTHYRQKKTKSRRKKGPEEAKLPLDEERPSLSISFHPKKS